MDDTKLVETDTMIIVVKANLNLRPFTHLSPHLSILSALPCLPGSVLSNVDHTQPVRLQLN